MNKKIRILIMGGTGMLGHTLFRHLSGYSEYDVYATARSLVGMEKHFSEALLARFHPAGVDANDFDSVSRAFA